MAHDNPDPRLSAALRALRDDTRVPDIDRARQAALLMAFDAPRARGRRRVSRVMPRFWALAAATAVLVAVTLYPVSPPGRNRGDGPIAPPAVVSGDFTIVPGAATLPPLESGSLVRMDLPVSVLPSLGIRPPLHARTTVTADLIVGQDGLTRAVRLVN